MQGKKFPWRVLLGIAALLTIEYFIFKYFYRKYDITLGFDRLASVVFIIFIMFAFDCTIAGCALIPNTANKFKLKRILAISIGSVALTAGATAIMCNYVPPEGTGLETPTYAQIDTLTMQEMQNGVAVSGEVSLTNQVESWRQENPERTYFGTKYYKKIESSRPIAGEERSFFYRVRLTDGTERDFTVFSDEKYDYIEELSVGLWRYQRGKTMASSYDCAQSAYQRLTYDQAFGQYAAERKFSIMPGYNGAGKAIILTTIKGKIEEWTTFRIPDELAAARAEDVRYLVLVDVVEQIKTGEWVTVETGEKVGDAYDTYCFAAIYDLETGETHVFDERTSDSQDMWDKIVAYLEHLK